MENKYVGFLIIGIAILMAFIVLSFNTAMTEIVNASCSHGSSCPMWGTIDFQTNMSIAIIVFVVLIGAFLVFSKDEKVVERVVEKVVKPQIKADKIKKENYEEVMKDLTEEEKKLLGIVIDEEGTIFQSSIVEKSGFSKVKVSRVLDKLQGKGLIDRRRRGMTNVVILKHRRTE